MVLKARYTMRLINRSTDKADLNKVLDYVSKSFTSGDDEATTPSMMRIISTHFWLLDSRAFLVCQ